MKVPVRVAPLQTMSHRAIETDSGRFALVRAQRNGLLESSTSYSQTALLFGVAGRPVEGQQWIDRAPMRRGSRPPGSVDVIPAGHRLHGWSGGDGEVAFLMAHFTDGFGEGRVRPELSVADPVLRQTMAKVVAAFELPQTEARMYSEALLGVLAVELSMRAGGVRRAEKAQGGLGAGALRRACEAMEASLEGGISLAALAEYAGCSPTHLSRAFKQSTGVPPFVWMLERRIERAKILLADPAMSLAEVGGCGGVLGATAVHHGVSPGGWNDAGGVAAESVGWVMRRRWVRNARARRGS